jgi:LPS-assembly protein
MDATISPSVLTRQGFLVEAEFRKRFHNGQVTLRAAGIDQWNPGVFSAGTSDRRDDFRGMVASEGRFKINPRWAFGWDVMVQSDNNFSRTYDLDGLEDRIHTNQVYLTGLGRRNVFDMRSFYFDVQDADPQGSAGAQAGDRPDARLRIYRAAAGVGRRALDHDEHHQYRARSLRPI